MRLIAPLQRFATRSFAYSRATRLVFQILSLRSPYTTLGNVIISPFIRVTIFRCSIRANFAAVKYRVSIKTNLETEIRSFWGEGRSSLLVKLFYIFQIVIFRFSNGRFKYLLLSRKLIILRNLERKIGILFEKCLF